MFRTHLMPALVCAALLTTATTATALPSGVTYVRSVEGLEEYRLDNGLQVVLFPDPSKPTVTVNITYFVGSRHEGYGERGMAHLLEHLLFKGSENHPNIYDELTSHGARPNGTTWTDRTNYFETFESSEENIDWALDLEADRMMNAFVTAEALEPEMTVVRNEFEIGENDPARVLEERVYSTAFLWHNYGLSTIGNRSDIENVPIENLLAFYKKWYRPDNALLVVGGQFEKEWTLGKIVEKFGHLENPDEPLPDTYTTEPAQDGERLVTLRRVGDTQIVSAGYHVPAGTHPDYAAVSMLAFLLGDTPSGRLHANLVEPDLATNVRANADQFKEPGLLYVTASLRPDQSLEAAEAEFLRTIESFSDTAPTEEEVDRARESLLRRWESRARNSSWAAIRLSEWASMGDWRFMFLHRDRLKEVTPADVARVAEAYLVRENRTLGRFVPTETPMRVAVAAIPPIDQMIGDYTGGEAMAMGEAFDPTPNKVEERIVRKSLPIGLDLIMLPKKTRGETVNLAMRLHYGDEKSLAGTRRAALFMGDMMMRGTESRDRQAIEDDIARLRATVNVNSSTSSLTGNIQAERGQLADAVALLGDLMRNPAFPSEEFDLLKKETLLELTKSRTEPRFLATNRITRHLNPWPASDPRYVPTIDEDIDQIEALTRDDVKRFHNEFVGASYGELSVVGDFDPDALVLQIEQLFGDWASQRPYARLENGIADEAPINEAIQVADKESAVFRAGLRMPMRDDHPDYPALTLGNFMTGGGFLNSRLATRIRVKDGLSYGVRSWFGASSFDEMGWFGGWAIYAPQNDERLLNAFREEIEAIIDDGFTAEEIADAKSGWLKRQNVSRGNDRELVWKLLGQLHTERTMAWDAALEEKVESLSSEEIHEAFRKHIDPKKISIVRVGDFRKGEGDVQASRAD